MGGVFRNHNQHSRLQPKKIADTTVHGTRALAWAAPGAFSSLPKLGDTAANALRRA
jgi:hypothetical protein